MDTYQVVKISVYKEWKENGVARCEIVKPGNYIEVDKNDPRLPLWLGDGVLIGPLKQPESTEEGDAPVRKAGRPPKVKE